MRVFTCPFCGFLSHNPNDAAERYCVRCHVFADDVLSATPGYRRLMARTYRRYAAMHPDQAEQTQRTAAAWEHGL